MEGYHCSIEESPLVPSDFGAIGNLSSQLFVKLISDVCVQTLLEYRRLSVFLVIDPENVRIFFNFFLLFFIVVDKIP